MQVKESEKCHKFTIQVQSVHMAFNSKMVLCENSESDLPFLDDFKWRLKNSYNQIYRW